MIENDINIPSLEGLFEDNKEIILSLERICSDTSDIIADIQTLEYNVQILNDTLSGELTIEEPNDYNLKTYIDELTEFVYEKTVYLTNVIPKFEAQITRYNLGDYNLGVDDLWSIDASTVVSTIGTVLTAFENSALLKGIGFILQYGSNPTDAATGQASDAISTVAWPAIKKAILRGARSGRILSDEIGTAWVNVGIGSIAVSFVAGLIELYELSSEGKMTEKDWERLGWEVLGAFSSTAIGGAAAIGAEALTGILLGSSIGGKFGGAVGALIGAVVAWGVSELVSWIGAEVVGDKIIDTFVVAYDEDGNPYVMEWHDGIDKELEEDYYVSWMKYEVPKNGNGPLGTYDVILEYEQKHEDFTDPHLYYFGQNWNDIRNEQYPYYMSQATYNRLLYTDWEGLCREVTDFGGQVGYDNLGYNVYTVGDRTYVEDFNCMLEEVLSFEDVEDAKQFYYNYTWESEGAGVVSRYLMEMYGFDIEAYYQYNKGNPEQLGTTELLDVEA